MKKILKKVMALAMAGSMIMGMGVMVSAAENTGFNTTVENPSDTESITLIKDYVRGADSAQDSVSPEETFTFTIERYGLWNVGEDGNGSPKYTKNNMPTFENGASSNNSIFTISALTGGEAGAVNNSLKATLNVPTYEAVGDYWYQVTETNNNVAGVIYGTNDSQRENLATANGAHNATYYIHVQVTNGAIKGDYIRTVTLHKEAPDANEISNVEYEKWYSTNNQNTAQVAKKVTDIQNAYYAGNLSITKEVTGNAGDKNELFEVTVEFKNESGASMNSIITYDNFYDQNGKQTTGAQPLNWNEIKSDTFECKFYIKDGTTVTFKNIPYGVTYTIKETQPKDDKYTHSFSYTANTNDAAGTFNNHPTKVDEVIPESTTGNSATNWNAASATGSISDALDSVTITNTKTSTIDIGVITSNAPYITMLLLAMAAAVLFVRGRRNKIEE